MEKEIRSFCADIRASLGENVRSIILYGSALGDNFVRGWSNVNLLVVVEKLDFEVLKKASPIIQRGFRKNKILPLFLTESQISSSLDVFPIEFLELKENHRLLYGEDILKGIEVPKENLRLQCEHGLKSALIQLKSAYLKAGGNRHTLREILTGSLASIKTLVKAARGFSSAKEIYEEPLFSELLQLKKRGRKTIEVEELFARYLSKIEALVEKLDLL